MPVHLSKRPTIIIIIIMVAVIVVFVSNKTFHCGNIDLFILFYFTKSESHSCNFP